MLHMDTIALICSIVLCVIGVATFVSSMISKARQDGQILTKLDFCLQAIEEVKKDFSTHREVSEKIRLTIQSHEEQIHTLFNRVTNVEERVDKFEQRQN